MREVVFVGTSDAFGAGGRRQSAYLVRAASGSVLLDCGTTTGTGLAALGIEREEVDAIVLSHFHADHFGGVPLFLLGALYEDARRKPLIVAGPPGVEMRVRGAATALGHSIEGRRWSFPLHFVDLPAGAERTVGPVSICPFETLHSPESHPHGFTVSAGGRRITYSGDTGWFDALPARVRGSELFVCECTFVSPEFEYHLSLEELAGRRAEFDCGRMILTHLGEAMRSREQHDAYEVADDGLVAKL
jgi:ribonuclease BN (tRNA processing enzyme)